MGKDAKEVRKDYYNLEIKVRGKTRTCFYPRCYKKTIGSHNISEAFLATLAEDGHVRCLNIHPYKGLEFARIGIRKATCFEGFCPEHDAMLFKQIDIPGIDLNSKNNLLLMNYRACIQEQLKKINRGEVYHESAKQLQRYDFELIPYFKTVSKQYQFNYAVNNWYANQLLAAIDTGDNSFLFRHITTEYIPVAASELFTLEPQFVSALRRKCFTKTNVLMPFSDIYIHIVPAFDKSHSTVILSMHRKDEAVLLNFYKYLSELSSTKMLSDLLLLYLELWVCSESFYLAFIKERMDTIKSIFSNTSIQVPNDRETLVNIFE